MKHFRKIQLVMAALLIGVGIYVWQSDRPFYTRAIHVADSEIFRQVLLINDADRTTVTTHLVFPSGEAQNPFTQGLAHYLEHLVWLNTTDDKEQKLTPHSNAWTSSLSTGYWLDGRPDQLRELINQILRTVAPIELDQKFAETERNIVQREFDFRITDNPLYSIQREIEKSLYGNHPLARSVIGQRGQITQFSLREARELHALTHRLSDATLLVIGPVKPRKLRQVLHKLDAPTPNRVKPTRFPGVLAPELIEFGTDPQQREDHQSYRVKRLREPFFIYQQIMPLPDCGTWLDCDVAITILRQILDSTRPEGFAGPLRFDNFIARRFSMDMRSVSSDLLLFRFSANPDVNVSLDHLADQFREILARTVQSGITPNAFRQVQNQLISDLENTQDLDRYHENVARFQLARAEPIYTIEERLKALKRVSRDDVNHILRQIAGPSRIVTRKISIRKDD